MGPTIRGQKDVLRVVDSQNAFFLYHKPGSGQANLLYYKGNIP